ncbi:MAG: acyl-CoA thioesterase [Ruminococcus sp.]|nr:acyl-CoA thioesterase [Ruminococcus sp.]
MKHSTYRLTVRGYELDSFGHVNNSVYLQYAETALWNFFSSTGLLSGIEEDGLFPVVLESTQRYLRELKLLDEVRIDSALWLKNGLINYRHIIIRQSDGTVACKVNGKIALVNRERIICDVPDAVKLCLESEPDEFDK